MWALVDAQEAKRLALKSAELATAKEQYGLKALAYKVCTDVVEYFPSDDEENTLLRLQFCKQFLAAARESQITELIRDAHRRLANCYIDIAEGRASVGMGDDVSPEEIVEAVQSSEEDIARYSILPTTDLSRPHSYLTKYCTHFECVCGAGKK